MVVAFLVICEVSMMTNDVSGVGVALYYKRTQHLFVCAVVTFCCFLAAVPMMELSQQCITLFEKLRLPKVYVCCLATSHYQWPRKYHFRWLEIR